MVRSYRDFAAGRSAERPRVRAADDQLAELARLISQGVPMNRSGRSPDRTSPAAEEQDSNGAQDEVLREPNDDPHPALEESRAWPDVRDSRYRDDKYENEPHDDDHTHDDENYEEPNTGRRGGFVLVAVIFGLAVLGTAGVFAYRATLGGPMLPTLPPIIKAEVDPNKIIPSHANSRANNSRQPDAGTALAQVNRWSRARSGWLRPPCRSPQTHGCRVAPALRLASRPLRRLPPILRLRLSRRQRRHFHHRPRARLRRHAHAPLQWCSKARMS